MQLLLFRSIGYSIRPLERRFAGHRAGKMSDYLTVSYVTAPNEEVAQTLGRKLIESRLAACVNVIKTIESIYEWKDKVEHDNESLLIIKSLSSKTDDLTSFVEKNHPYECPEVITIKVDRSSKKYLEWVAETLGKPVVATSPAAEKEHK